MNDWRPENIIAGEFKIERMIGRGGFGDVVLAVNQRSGENYAIKRIRKGEFTEQSRLIIEAQRWIAIPTHPNITACRFVRSVGDELAVFSEYMPSGSLSDRIRSGVLYQSRDTGLRNVLLAAAHMAWGLDAAHSIGLLHLDVKPTNVLFTQDGIAKITDFGLAAIADSASRTLSYGAISEGRSTIAAVPSGLTTAYASPEQAEGRRVGRAADIWSWAATILEAFLGERTWTSGTVVGYVLEWLMRGRLPTRGIALPPEIAELLRVCLLPDPAQRPHSFHDVAEAVVAALPREPGQPLPQPPPRPSIISTASLLRRSGSGVTWMDPQGILELAYEAVRRDPVQAEQHRHHGLGSRRADILADLQAFQDARQVLLEVTPHTQAQKQLLAVVHANIASIKVGLDDLPGAVLDTQKALELLTALDSVESRWYLPKMLMFLAENLPIPERLDEALRACDQSFLATRWVDDQTVAAADRGRALMTRANLVRQRALTASEGRSVFRLCDKAATAFRAAGDAVGEASALGFKAAAMASNGHAARAAALWDEADAKLVALDNADPAVRAARALHALNRAARSSRTDDTMRYASLALDIYRPLVRDHGDFELGARLGYALLVAGRGYERQGRLTEALAAYREARHELEQAVLWEAHTDAIGWLADCYGFEAALTQRLEGPEQSISNIKRAIDLWQRITRIDDRGIWALHLADARQRLATVLISVGNTAEAVELFDVAEKDLHRAHSGTPGRALLVAARIQTGRAQLEYRNGNIIGAYQSLQNAVTILQDASDAESVTHRIRAYQTMAAVISSKGQHAQAARILESTVQDMQALVASSALPLDELAGLHEQLAKEMLRDGDLTEAMVTGHQALEEYHRLLSAGSTEFILPMANTGIVVGLALLRSADLPGAVMEFQRWPPLLDEEQAVETQKCARRIRDLLDELETIVNATPDDLPRLIGMARDHIKVAVQVAISGKPEEASILLEDLHGKVLWLSNAYPRQETIHIHADTALPLGVSATHCGRLSAAHRALQHALKSYEILVTEYGRKDFTSAWLDAHLWLARSLLSSGELPSARTVLGSLAQLAAQWTPEETSTWSQRIEGLLAELASDAESKNMESTWEEDSEN